MITKGFNKQHNIEIKQLCNGIKPPLNQKNKIK